MGVLLACLYVYHVVGVRGKVPFYLPHLRHLLSQRFISWLCLDQLTCGHVKCLLIFPPREVILPVPFIHICVCMYVHMCVCAYSRVSCSLAWSRTCDITDDEFELLILQLPHSKCWDCRCLPAWLGALGIQPSSPWVLGECCITRAWQPSCWPHTVRFREKL